MQHTTTAGAKSIPKRSKDWNEGLAEDLKDPEFAREFVLAALEDGIDLQHVLRKIVRSYGVKEYAEKAQIASSSLLRAVDPSHNLFKFS